MNSRPPEERLIAHKLDGKSASRELEAKLTKLISELPTPPCLALINVGTEYASELYVKRKIEACARVGIRSISYDQPVSSAAELLGLIYMLNSAPDVSGILVQLPLPHNIATDKILTSVSPAKDVDGFHPENLGRTLIGESYLSPATPTGIIHLLECNGIQLKGKRVAVIGRSVIVGRPMAAMLTNADATVTLCHSQTQNLKSIVQDADIIVAAVGSKWLIKPEMVKPGAVVVDVGINRTNEGTLVGDVHPDVANVADWLTPVPGGVGPMTIAALLSNTLKAYLMSTPDALQYLTGETGQLLSSLYPDLL
jgi:methylenetetrahydrofolate dehydrogenase (NADP+)/methenyltetrahydrofolate cyclohydrolase